jgi:hypothetical protein
MSNSTSKRWQTIDHFNESEHYLMSFRQGIYKHSPDSKSDVADVSTKERANETWITGWRSLYETHLFNHLNGTLQVLNELDTVEHNFLSSTGRWFNELCPLECPKIISPLQPAITCLVFLSKFLQAILWMIMTLSFYIPGNVTSGIIT